MREEWEEKEGLGGGRVQIIIISMYPAAQPLAGKESCSCGESRAVGVVTPLCCEAPSSGSTYLPMLSRFFRMWSKDVRHVKKFTDIKRV